VSSTSHCAFSPAAPNPALDRYRSTEAATRAAHLIVDDTPPIFSDTFAYTLLGDTAEGPIGRCTRHSVLETGGYRPPAGMRKLVERTHQVCAFPTCDRPAPRCDLDHTIAWHRDGPTCPCNLSALCRRHHRLKQHPQWCLFQPWPGLLVWVTPAGK
jgi:hypothetical protein